MDIQKNLMMKTQTLGNGTSNSLVFSDETGWLMHNTLTLLRFDLSILVCGV